MAAETELERAIFTLPFLRCEMKRHHLTDNVNMCGLFARRGEDFVGLPRECVSFLALQSNVTALTQEAQELIGHVESHVFHFQARQEFREEGRMKKNRYFPIDVGFPVSPLASFYSNYIIQVLI